MAAQVTVTGPSMNRGGSKQDYETPADFIAAVEARWGALTVDLAATRDNTKAPIFLTPEDDSFSHAWASEFPAANMWLNPPFSDIAPWAAKCAAEARLMSPWQRILMLVPASVGANWFASHVHRKCLVLGLQGRITFVGAKDAYPKDCILAVYGHGLNGFDVWPWRAR